MSATPETTWTVHCDHPGCREHVTGTETESREAVRRELEGRGWATGIRDGVLLSDYCPEHRAAGEGSG